MVQMRMEGFKKIRTTSTIKDEDLQQVIENDGTNSSVSGSSSVVVVDCSSGKPLGWRHFFIHFISSNKFQIGIVCLVIFSCLLVITELLIELHVFKVMANSRFLLPRALRYASIALFGTFVCEVIIKLSILRSIMWYDKMEVFDVIVVLTTFSMDLAFAENEGLLSGVGLLIVLRLWRVTKILNGIIMTVKHQAERRLARERRNKEAIELELAKFREYCSSQEMEIELLQDLLTKHGIRLSYSERPSVNSTVDVVADINRIYYEDKSDCPQDVRDAVGAHLI